MGCGKYRGLKGEGDVLRFVFLEFSVISFESLPYSEMGGGCRRSGRLRSVKIPGLVIFITSNFCHIVSLSINQ